MSQYKDQITGEILLNIRASEDKILELSSSDKYYRPNPSNTLTLQTTQTKFSPTSIYFPDRAAGIYFTFKNMLLGGDYTFGFWIYQPEVPAINYINSYICFILHWANNSSTVYNSNQIESMPSISCNLSGGIGRIGRLIAYNNANRDYVRNSQPTAISYNSWHYYAETRSDKLVRVFVDGVQVAIEGNMLESYWTGALEYVGIYNARQYTDVTYPFYLDDLVLIKGQALWTDTFTVPDNYLIGDQIPNRLKAKNIIYPVPTYSGDYFDQAYLY